MSQPSLNVHTVTRTFTLYKYATADSIRDELNRKGIEVDDKARSWRDRDGQREGNTDGPDFFTRARGSGGGGGGGYSVAKRILCGAWAQKGGAPYHMCVLVRT